EGAFECHCQEERRIRSDFSGGLALSDPIRLAWRVCQDNVELHQTDDQEREEKPIASMGWASSILTCGF
ncbi:hypothetical protein CRG98_040942, partial [Punica granatum]